jgi:hypothetical protein
MRMGGATRSPKRSFASSMKRVLKSGARTILIGHSFGALVVERAVEQAMTGGLLNGTPILPADLVLLVNSAAESIYAKEMRDMMVSTLHFETGHKMLSTRRRPGCYMKDEPRIISVTSVTRSGDRLAFPIARPFSAPVNSTGNMTLRRAGRLASAFFSLTPPGHNERLLDHAILPLENRGPAAAFHRGSSRKISSSRRRSRRAARTRKRHRFLRPAATNGPRDEPRRGAGGGINYTGEHAASARPSGS